MFFNTPKKVTQKILNIHHQRKKTKFSTTHIYVRAERAELRHITEDWVKPARFAEVKGLKAGVEYQVRPAKHTAYIHVLATESYC